MQNTNIFPPVYSPTSQRVILTPGAFAKNHLLFLQEVGQYRLLKAGHETHRENLRSFLLVSVQSGKGELFYNGRTFPLSAGEFFFIDCQQPHSYRSSVEEPWGVWWAHFNGRSAKGYYELFCKRSALVFTSGKRGRIDRLLAEMLAINLAPGQETELHNARLLTEMVTLLVTEGAPDIQEYANVPSDRDATLIQVRGYLAEHCAQSHTLDKLAERFHISKYHLVHEFKRFYNQTPIEYLLQQRITRAKELLRFTGSSIAEVAEACGFNEPSYFNRQFKKTEGCSASEYRKQWRG